jgi:hypothetical protein
MKGILFHIVFKNGPLASSWVLAPKEQLIDIPFFFNRLELSLEHMVNNFFLEMHAV